MKRKLSALVLALALCLSLAACGGGGGSINKFDAKVYVNGLLQETYLGVCDQEYLDLVGADAAEVMESHLDSLEVDIENFFYYFGIEYPTPAMNDAVRDIYEEIYTHAKFEVTSAAKQEDGSFSVKVAIEPIDIMTLVDGKWDDAMAEFYVKYPDEVYDEMTEEQYKEVDKEYGEMVIALVQSLLPDTGNLPREEVVVQIEKDADDYYSLADGDFMRLDERIIEYP